MSDTTMQNAQFFKPRGSVSAKDFPKVTSSPWTIAVNTQIPMKIQFGKEMCKDIWVVAQLSRVDFIPQLAENKSIE